MYKKQGVPLGKRVPNKGNYTPHFKGFKFIGDHDEIEQFLLDTLKGRHYIKLNESGSVHLIPGMNPDIGMLCGTNVYAIGTGKKRFLVDAGERDVEKFLENVEKFVTDMDCDIEGILITHSHFDHMEGA
mmetsp:Transcript_24502/g.38004  ORF Transcript_24502/g.38004 Transcript_24502/m.38004 type:complete len:129 (-) Transcript_24502:844-1230(-)